MVIPLLKKFILMSSPNNRIVKKEEKHLSRTKWNKLFKQNFKDTKKTLKLFWQE